MASHRKPRTRIMQSAASKRGAIGVTTAALASVTLLSQSANAAPADDGGRAGKQSIEEVKKRVDELYQQAEVSTQKYNAAKEKSDAQREKVDDLLDQVAKRTDKLNDARRLLGNYATAQYRSGAVSETATLLLTQDPQSFFKQSHLMDRMTGRQKEAVTDYQKQQAEASAQRSKATHELSSLTSSQKKLKDSKREVQSKLSEARSMLSKLTAQEKKRLAEIERKKRAEAKRKAAERAEAERRRRQQEGDQQGGSGSGSSAPSGSYEAKAEKVISFAKGQLGKPYVWGATGPSSYDCSGLTQDAWKAAGISLPRTTWDQVKVGTTVSKSQLRAGDLIFFYDDISHVGLYVGNGQMIHAPKPGDSVKYESIDYMPFHSAVRPA